MPERPPSTPARPVTVCTIMIEREAVKAGSCIHSAIESVARAHPDRIAAVCGSDTLSYRELDRRANNLAHRLVARGVGPESLVGIMVRPSLDLAVAVLGVLKSGGAYVPLDPAYPPDRLRFMIGDAGLHQVVSTPDLAPTLPDPKPQVESPLPDPRSAHQDGAPPPSGVGPANAAYVIYTSGSTGKPKGVVVEHRGIEPMARNSTVVYRITPESRVLQWASFNFDAAVCDFFATWIVGATLVLASAEEKAPGPALAALVKQQRVSAFWTTPTVLSATPMEGLDTLKTIGSVGEACTPELVTRWSEGGRHFVNGYGPTEYTVFATAGDASDNAESPSIGRPLDGVALHLVDPDTMVEVADGEEGEIVLGGVQVARGYLNRPDLTDDRFVKASFAEGRLYRTGDLARRRDDGALEFVGRVDDQVKIRGYRIELGEIEGALSALPEVRDAAVRIAPDGTGGERILGYFVAENGVAEPAPLLTRLKGELPAHMVPQQLIRLDSFPLTPNGKLARDALPVPVASPDAGPSDHQTDTERQLASIWCEALGLAQVSRDDGFMDVGGHSMAALAVLQAIEEAFGETIEARVLLTEPLFEVARQIDAGEKPPGKRRGLLGRLAGRVGIR